MRSIPYKNVISSYTVFNKTQLLTLSILKAKIEIAGNDMKIANKGTLKVEFITCTDHPTLSGRKKLLLDTKLETYIGDQTIFEILTKKQTSLEFKNYQQELIKFNVANNGFE